MSYTFFRRCSSMAIFAFIIIAMSANMSAAKYPVPNKKNTFETPDFAFPKTVEANASAELKSAIRKQNPSRILNALEQLCVASSIRDAGNASEMASQISNTAMDMSEGWQALGWLLEARLYCDIYQANSWKYNNRMLPEDSIPENPEEWSKGIFSSKVTRLVEHGLQQLDFLKRIPIKDVGNAVTGFTQTSGKELTAALFWEMEALRQLLIFYNPDAVANVIPFGNVVATSDKEISKLISKISHELTSENAIESYREISDPVLNLFLRTLPRNHRFPTLISFYKSYSNNDFGIAALCLAAGYLSEPGSDQESYYATLKKEIKRHSDDPDFSRLRNIWYDAVRPSAVVEFQDQCLPESPINITVNRRNVNKAEVRLYRLAGYSKTAPTVADAMRSGKVVETILAEGSEEMPFETKDTLTFRGIKPGIYTIIITDENGKVINPKNRIDYLLVSSLSSVQVTDPLTGQSNLFITNGRNQHPIPGAKVSLTSRNTKSPTLTLYSDNEGKIELPKGTFYIEVSKDLEKLRFNLWENGRGMKDPEPTLRGALYTDLGIVHPGDSVRVAAVVWNSLKGNGKVVPDKKLNIELRDVNYQKVDSANLITDIDGRCNTSLQIPKEGLLGQYHIYLKDKNKEVAYSNVMVADYKAPSFFVDVTPPYQEKDSLIIEGRAATYSGMPVSGAKVNYTIEFLRSWWKYFSYGRADYGGSVTTSSDGTFRVALDISSLPEQYLKGTYSLRADVTAGDGETQFSPTVKFGIGKAYSLSSSIPETYKNNSGTGRFMVKAVDIVDSPVKRKVCYRVMKDSVVITKGDFESPDFPVDFNSLPSGSYKIEFSGEDLEPLSSEIIVWSENDKIPPVETQLWIPERKVVAASGKKSVDISVGSSYKDSRILCQIGDPAGNSYEKWITVDSCITKVTLPVPNSGQRVIATLYALHNLDSKSATITVIPEEDTKKLEIKAESFRDKIVPGEKESWKFHVTYGTKTAGFIPIFAVMTDKALDALTAHQWGAVGISPWIVYPRLSSPVSPLQISSYYSFGGKNAKSIKLPQLPDWNSYGYGFYAANRTRFAATEMKLASAPIMIRGNGKEEAVEYASASAKMYAGANGATSDAADLASEESAAEGNSETTIPLRPDQLPLAFFMPDLKTDNAGISDIRFEVPNFNTTWKLQLAGYTPDVKGAVITLDAEASKPVMVKANVPRFIRTGDSIRLQASLYNATDSVRRVGGRIEIFNPANGEIIKSQDFAAEDVEASAGKLIAMNFMADFGYDMIGFRAYALSDLYSDGEQVLIGILPSSSPVLDSYSFYLNPDSQSFSLELPELSSDSKVTLEYCANPIWTCVTALPDLVTPEDNSVLSLGYALYGNALASALSRKYPQLKEAITLWKSLPADKSPLISALQKNENLKLVALNATPWVNNAASETLRMSRLESITDSASAASAVETQLSKLAKLQKTDGGWSWCDGMKSSAFITTLLLQEFADLKRNDALPLKSNDIIRKAIAFCDKEYATYFAKYPKALTAASLTTYLYVRDAFGFPATGDFLSLKIKAVKKIKSDWRDLSIGDAAKAAIILNNEKYPMEARTVLESLRQKAVITSQSGMAFENLPGGFTGAYRLHATSLVLNAFNTILPGDKAVDQLRQWLLTRRRTQDWGDNRYLSGVIASILSTGSDWMSTSEPSIHIGSESIDSTPFDRFTGTVFTQLDPAKASRSILNINKHGTSPAWGGIMTQYVMPMQDVKAHSVGELSVSKEIFKLEADSEGLTASRSELKPGDRVAITLTLVCDRDLDFVAVTDERGAYFEPVDQISGYHFSDGIGYYREVRNSSTNLFFERLPKGTHIIRYECVVSQQGSFSVGIATAQSLYSPMISAHSSGAILQTEAQ